MIVSPRPSQAAGVNVVGHDIGVVGELLTADGALAVLGHNLLVQQPSHFRIRAEFPISPRMMGILDPPDAHLSSSSSRFRERFSAAAEKGAVNRAELVATESHGSSPIGGIVRFCVGSGRAERVLRLPGLKGPQDLSPGATRRCRWP